MVEALESLPFFKQTQLIYKENGQYYFVNPCYFGLFRWDGIQWKEVSGLEITGYNCSPYLFFHEGKVATLTGLGYWQGRSDLFYFEEGKKPAFIPTQNQPEHYSGRMIFKSQKGLFSLLGDRYNVVKKPDEPFLHGFFLEFESLAWKTVQFEFTKKFQDLVGKPGLTEDLRLGPVFETKDYAGIELKFDGHSDFAWLIIDKSAFQLFLKEIPKNYLEPTLWIQLEGNMLRFLASESFKFKEINLEEFISSAEPVGRLQIREMPKGFEKYLPDWKNALLGLAMILLIVWVYWKSLKVHYVRNPDSSIKEEPLLPSNYSNWLMKLRPHSGNLITQKELEEILGVQVIKNQDLRKVRRSRAIKALNDHMMEVLGKPIIQRERDEQDKRVILYRVQEFSKTKTIEIPEIMMD